MSDTGPNDRSTPATPAPDAGPGSSTQSVATSPPVAAPISTDQPTVITDRAPLPLSPVGGGATPPELGQTLVGTQLDHFDLQEYVGGGGMGAVFRALDTRLNRIVALKVLALDQANDEDKIRRFQNEAQSAARLDHDHIARVYYVGQDRSLHYIVFEFIDGINLRDLIDRRGVLSLDEAISFTLQIAQALNHASSRDVVHRDIKPSNVLIAAHGRAKLVDMGLARLHQVEQSRTDLTSSGVTLGTFDYISPEQARDPRLADVRSDIYSLGCTLFYMLTAQPPFPDGNVLQKLLQHNNDPPPDPVEFNPELPEQVSRVVRKMLAKDPRRRYQTPDELIADLLLLVEQLQLRVHLPDDRSWNSRKPGKISVLEQNLPWIAPVVVLLITIFVLDYLWSEPAPTPGPRSSANSGQGGLPKTVTPSQTIPDNAPNAAIGPRQPPGPESTASTGTGSTVTPDSDNTAGPTENDLTTTQAGQPVDDNGSVAEAGTSNPLRARLSPADDATGLSADPTASLSPILTDTVAVSAIGASAGINASTQPTGAGAEVSPVDVPSRSTAAESGVLVVDPIGTAANEYPTLKAAYAAASANDTIELRYNGPRPERPLRISKSVTICASAEYHPVVRFRPTELEPSTAMVSVVGGNVQWRGVSLEFDIPSHTSLPAESWSLFELQRPERLQLDRCTLTIRNATEQNLASHTSVAFFDFKAPPGSEAMAMDKDGAPLPEQVLALFDCIARGEATLLRTTQSQPIQVTWLNGLLATSERLLLATGGDVSLRNTGQVAVSLEHVTAICAGGLCQLKNLDSDRHLLPTNIQCVDCILVGPADLAPLVEQFGIDAIQDFESQLIWKSTRCFYTGYSTFWQIASLSEPQGETRNFAKWQQYWGETGDAGGFRSQIVWNGPPPQQRPFHAQTAANYRLDDKALSNYPLLGASAGGFDIGLKAADLPQLSAPLIPAAPATSPTPLDPGVM